MPRKFQNRVYEQADSYAKLAEELKLEVEDRLAPPAQVQAIAAGNQKFAQTVFVPASVAAKKNSEAIDLGNNNLISARVIDYKPSAVRPLDDVSTNRAAVAAQTCLRAGPRKLAQRVAALAAGKDANLTFGASAEVCASGTATECQPSASEAGICGPTCPRASGGGWAQRRRRLLGGQSTESRGAGTGDC